MHGGNGELLPQKKKKAATINLSTQKKTLLTKELKCGVLSEAENVEYYVCCCLELPED